MSNKQDSGGEEAQAPVNVEDVLRDHIGAGELAFQPSGINAANKQCERWKQRHTQHPRDLVLTIHLQKEVQILYRNNGE